MFEAARLRQPIPTAAMQHGGQAVITAIGHSNIRTWLDIVWSYDDVTYQHCLLVAGLCAAFSIELGYSLKSQRLLSESALIHDIGKARIPLEILNKPGKLSAPEMTIMRTHPVVGYDMLSGQKGMDPRLLDIVRHHHEYLDGSGYPDALSDDKITDLVRLTNICDIYAALIEKRPYKTVMSSQKALSILDDMSPRLDDGLVRQFHKVVANYD